MKRARAQIDRRTFATMVAGSLAAAAGTSWGQARGSQGKTVFYAAVGPELTLFDVDVTGGTLNRHSSITLPANVHYAWPHPSKRYFYIASSNGGPGASGIVGDRHYVSVLRVDPASGALSLHGEVRMLPSRPIHVSVDNAGEYALTAHNNPSTVLVHRINRDGTLGEIVKQPTTLDTGIFAHQIRTTPSNRTAVLVTRGNNATGGKPEDPGALKVFGFKDGVLTNMASIAPGTGLGFGPRHLDFHPTRPFVFVSVERQNQIHVYRLEPDGGVSRDPLFVKATLAGAPGQQLPSGDGAGTIHLHPNGRFAYIPNRAASTIQFQGKNVFAGGENNIAVFELNEATGEPILRQNIDGHGIQLRTFSIDPTGRLLVAASIMPLLIREGDRVSTLAAGLSVYRIGGDGRLTFVRKYDVDTSKGTQFWSGMVTLA
jgi:6-phosphogluconolactonase